MAREVSRPRLVAPATLRLIDRWFAQTQRNKVPPAKVVAYKLGISISTLYNAASRRDRYVGIP